MEIAQDMLDCANNDLEFTKTIITGDETWVYGYDPGTKFQSSQWKHPESLRPKKARQVRSNVKVMLTCFFNSRGIMHHEYAPEGQTINKEYYLEILRRFRDAVLKKRPHMWTEKNWQLHHDNAPAHSVHVIKGFLAKNNTALVRQPPSTPALAPRDFLIFPKLKTTLKGTRFQSRLHQSTTAATWWCGPRRRFGLGRNGCWPSRGSQLSRALPFIFSLCCPLNDRKRAAHSIFKIGRLFSLFSCPFSSSYSFPSLDER